MGSKRLENVYEKNPYCTFWIAEILREILPQEGKTFHSSMKIVGHVSQIN
jgi:hypothetical protein